MPPSTSGACSACTKGVKTALRITEFAAAATSRPQMPLLLREPAAGGALRAARRALVGTRRAALP